MYIFNLHDRNPPLPLLPEETIDAIGKTDRYKQYLKKIDDLSLFYLNHPANTFGLLRQHDVQIVVGTSEKSRDHYYLDGWKGRDTVEHMNNETLHAMLAKKTSALFVIDMQNDFALPPRNPALGGRKFADSEDDLARGILDDLTQMQTKKTGWGVTI